ncbi:hypothetical protein [Caballeronia sp. KNU42]
MANPAMLKAFVWQLNCILRNRKRKMTRQRYAPLLIPAGGAQAIRLSRVSGDGTGGDASEADIQRYVHAHASCLPIAEIDPIFTDPIAICTELPTPAGPIDNFMVTASGLPVLVECKLWRNPEARREVVGQILDYAKELSRWSSSDLQRAVRQRLKCGGDPVLEKVRAVAAGTDEIHFNDSLTSNLRRGRFLLLIVGDGIREGVEAIGEYLQAHAGLHFSLGLVEMPIFAMPDGGHLIVPRILARTTVITRTVVVVPDGYTLGSVEDDTAGAELDPDRVALADEQQKFWKVFLERLELDDPEQRVPKPARQGYLNFMLPAPGGSSWLNVYRDQRRNEVGVALSSTRNSAGEHAMLAIADDWNDVSGQLGGTTEISVKDGRSRISDSRTFEGLANSEEVREQAYAWLAERVNAFVNTLRPRVRSAVADYQNRDE